MTDDLNTPVGRILGELLVGKKVAELEDIELDRWVAGAQLGLSAPNEIVSKCPPFSSEWKFGGPIIELEHIHLESNFEDEWSAGFMIEDSEGEPHWKWMHGNTPLIAAMRAYVASVYGEEVPE